MKSKSKKTTVPKEVAGKSVGLTGFWQLGRLALTDFRADWKLYLGVVGLIAIPSNILITYFSASTSGTLQTYIGIAGLFMDVALLYAVVRKHREGDSFGLRTAFYSGSHAVLRFLVVTVLLALMTLPLGVASEVYSSGVSGTSVTIGESALLVLIGLPFILVSFWLLVRSILSWVVVVDREVRPVGAIKLAWQLTRKRFWVVAGRLLGLVLWIVLLLIVPVGIFAALYQTTNLSIFDMLLQISISLIGLPFITLYGFRLYDDLAQVAGV